MTGRLLIVGAGGHGKVVADSFICCNMPRSVCFLDDDEGMRGKVIIGIPHIGLAVKDSLAQHDRVHVAIGDNRARMIVSSRFSIEFFESVFHPNAFISRFSVVGAGSFAAAHSVVAAGAMVGQCSIINHGAIVDHDCQVGNFTHIAPHASLGGEVRIGDNVLVGSGARILPGVKIGSDVIVGAGAVVTKDVDDGKIIIGVPARQLLGNTRNS